jgi:hypothetical protein
MGALRPARRVSGPAGREWEVYVLRHRLPERAGDPDGDYEDDLLGVPILGAFALVSGAGAFVWHDLVAPTVRFSFESALELMRGRDDDRVWIEAICWDIAPYREHILWATTETHSPRVLDDVARGLEIGSVAEPFGATLESRSSD